MSKLRDCFENFSEFPSCLFSLDWSSEHRTGTGRVLQIRRKTNSKLDFNFQPQPRKKISSFSDRLKDGEGPMPANWMRRHVFRRRQSRRLLHLPRICNILISFSSISSSLFSLMNASDVGMWVFFSFGFRLICVQIMQLLERNELGFLLETHPPRIPSLYFSPAKTS